MGLTETLLIIFAVLILLKHIPLFFNTKKFKNKAKNFKFPDNLIATYSVCAGIIAYLLLAFLFVISNPQFVILTMFATFLFISALLASNPKFYNELTKLSLKQPDSWFKPISLISILLALVALYLAFYY
tara:strand:+ start:3642 stop:4028 length:387 start_codon:yes stop_codon:yes gene_type:complete